jgi:hypothetical protein
MEEMAVWNLNYVLKCLLASEENLNLGGLALRL